MGRFTRCTISLAVLIGLVVPLSVPECQAAEPTLARLSFWVQPERMSEFEVVYRETFVPILSRHGLVESSTRGRETRPEVFSRLFELPAPTDAMRVHQALDADTTWMDAIRRVEAAFLTIGPHDRAVAFQIYAVPSVPVRAIPAGRSVRKAARLVRGYWRTYDTTDGLGGAKVWDIIQDREGYLWFGTFGGVSRYDGQRWTTFTRRDGLPSNSVAALLEDRKGNIWAGTHGGVSRYDGTTWTTFTALHGLAHDKVWSLHEDREGNIWAATIGGISRYDGTVWRTFTARDGLGGNWVGAVHQDREGDLWCGTRTGLAQYRATQNTWNTYPIRAENADVWVREIAEDRDGLLWLGTERQGIYRFDGRTFTNLTTRDGLAGKRVLSIIQDPERSLWFATEHGASRYNGQTFINITAQDGLAMDDLNAVFQDRDGYVWFGHDGGGVSRYDGGVFTSFSTAEGLASNQVNAVLEDQSGRIWFGTGGGLTRYDMDLHPSTSQPREFVTTISLTSYVLCLIEDLDGNLWCGTWDSGVARYDGQSLTTFTTDDGLINNSVWGICQDRDGGIWIGSFDGEHGGGVSRYDGRGLTTFTVEDGLASNAVRSIFQDRDGMMWFGTQAGACRFSPTAGPGPEAWTTYSTVDGLGGGHPRVFFEDRDGTLWVGTFEGLSRFDGRRFTTFSKADGLANDQVTSIHEDENGHLWIGTLGGGVSRYDGQVFQTLTHHDGLAGPDIYDIEQDTNGNLWFASTSKGVTRYTPLPPSPPPVFVDAVVADQRYDSPSKLSLSSTAALIAFEFHGTSLRTRPGGMVYRYRLKGHDKIWQNTRANRVEYRSLPRGDYTFEVQAVDRDLVYSEAPATVELIVHMPYERIALLSALGIALVLIAWQAVRLVQRNRALHTSNVALAGANREIQEQTEHKSAFLASMAHDLRTPMNAIMGFTNLVLRRGAERLSDRHRGNLNKVIQASDHLLAMINDLMDLSKIEAGRMDVNVT